MKTKRPQHGESRLILVKLVLCWREQGCLRRHVLGEEAPRLVGWWLESSVTFLGEGVRGGSCFNAFPYTFITFSLQHL